MTRLTVVGVAMLAIAPPHDHCSNDHNRDVYWAGHTAPCHPHVHVIAWQADDSAAPDSDDHVHFIACHQFQHTLKPPATPQAPSPPDIASTASFDDTGLFSRNPAPALWRKLTFGPAIYLSCCVFRL